MPTATAAVSCLVVQHVAIEGPFGIATALRAAGVGVDVRRVDRGDALPADLSGHNALVVMGGPASAASDDGFPTRGHERHLLSDALERRLPTLGVCLGAQLLAVAGGGRVARGTQGPEIGWASQWGTAEAAADRLLRDAPARCDVLHWHADTFTLPAGASLLASSAAYPNQAFSLGPAAWGFQFHAEVDEAAVSGFVTHFPEELAAAGRSAEDILAPTAAGLAGLAPWRDAVFGGFAALASGRA